MNENIIKYLQENKDSLSKKELFTELINKGYDKNEIIKTINFMFSEENIKEEKEIKNNNNQIKKNKKNTKIIKILVIIIFIIFIGIFLFNNKNNNITNNTKESSIKIKNSDNIKININKSGKNTYLQLGNTKFLAYSISYLANNSRLYSLVEDTNSLVNQEQGIKIVIYPTMNLNSKEMKNSFKQESLNFIMDTIVDEWDNEKQDEYGFMVSKLMKGNNEKAYLYTFSNFSNNGKTGFMLIDYVYGDISKEDLIKISKNLRKVSLELLHQENLRNELENIFQNTDINGVKEKISKIIKNNGIEN